MKTKAERIMKGIWLLFLPIILSFSSCASVGPDYKPPEIDTPEKWQTDFSENISSGTDKSFLANYWRSFNDPLLDDLINRAIANNLSVKEAFTRLTEARLRRGISKADQFPSVNSSLSATKNRTSGISNEFYQVGIDASWEIDLFGGIRRSIEAYSADVDSANESLNDTLLSLTSEVALNYVELRLYQAQLNVTLSNLKTQEETNNIVTWRYEAGLVTALDLKKSQSTLEQTKSQLPGFQSKIAQTMNRISVLLGLNPGTLRQELNPVKPIPVLTDEIKTGIPADLLRQRPDLRKAERDLAAQTARIGVAVSELYPSISLSGSIRVDSSAVGDLIDSNYMSRSIGPSLSWPVFRAGAIRNNIKVQTTIADRLLVQYKALVLSAGEEVENALSSCLYEQMKRESLKKAADAASGALELSRLQYSSGLVDFEVLLEAQRTLLSLQDQVTQNEGQIAINYITLYKALGGGWSPDLTDIKNGANNG